MGESMRSAAQNLKTHNQLVQAVISRIQELRKLSLRELRTMHPDNTGGGPFRHVERDAAIEAIVYDEYSLDVDVELQ